MQLRERIKWWLFPGLNLHARLRAKVLPCEFGVSPTEQPLTVLDAGCGNGLLAYQHYLKGNSVLAMSIKAGEVARCRKLFHEFLRLDEARLSFEVKNLYDLDESAQPFDEIICSEVMEHLAEDAAVCAKFYRKLKPGGVLHLCCPNADHPDHRARTLDEKERGGHVRAGYTLESFQALLEPIGFRIERSRGLGGPVRQALNKRIIQAEELMGWPAAFLVFVFSLPFLPLDPDPPRVPYSVYVKAVKPASEDAT